MKCAAPAVWLSVWVGCAYAFLKFFLYSLVLVLSEVISLVRSLAPYS